MLSERRIWWQVPVLTGIIAVALDLFIDPIAVHARYWFWFVEGNVYYGIPLLNYVGWFALMTLAPLGWLLIARRREWGYWRKGAISLAAIVPLSIAAIGVSLLLNGLIGAFGLR